MLVIWLFYLQNARKTAQNYYKFTNYAKLSLQNACFCNFCQV